MNVLLVFINIAREETPGWVFVVYAAVILVAVCIVGIMKIRDRK